MFQLRSFIDKLLHKIWVFCFLTFCNMLAFTYVLVPFHLVQIVLSYFHIKIYCHWSILLQWLHFPFLVMNLEEQVSFLSWVLTQQQSVHNCFAGALAYFLSFYVLLKSHTSSTTDSIVLDESYNSIESKIRYLFGVSDHQCFAVFCFYLHSSCLILLFYVV
jgi:hypothetical protein